MNHKIGIIGGSGAFATSFLLQKINEYSVLLHQAKSDSDFLHTVTITTPFTNLDYKGYSLENSFSHVLNNVHDLESIGCNIIVMACNTLHQYWHKLTLHKRKSNTIILNLPEIVCSFMEQPEQRVGILCSQQTRELNIYEQFLTQQNKHIVYPSLQIQDKINTCINSVISNQNIVESKHNLELASDSLFQQNIDCVILGCTELSIIKPTKTVRNIYDSVELLALFLNQHFKE